MGFEWNAESQYERALSSPKLILAGSVDVTVSGHPFSLEFTGAANQIVIRINDVRKAWALRTTVVPVSDQVRRWLEVQQATVIAQVGSSRPVRLFPRPAWWVRMFNPLLR